MKLRLVVALVGLAMSFALPAFAQQKGTVDPQIGQQIRALEMKYDEAFNRGESGALAALYTEDAVRVTPHGTLSGRQAIAKDYAERVFQRYQCNNYVRKGDRVNAVGNDVRASGKWTCAFHDTDGKDKHIDGHYSWILVREGDSWKIRSWWQESVFKLKRRCCISSRPDTRPDTSARNGMYSVNAIRAQYNRKYGKGNYPGVGLIDEKQDLYGRHDQEGAKHQDPFPNRQIQFPILNSTKVPKVLPAQLYKIYTM